MDVTYDIFRKELEVHNTILALYGAQWQTQ
jgi:hypothetical protein